MPFGGHRVCHAEQSEASLKGAVGQGDNLVICTIALETWTACLPVEALWDLP